MTSTTAATTTAAAGSTTTVAASSTTVHDNDPTTTDATDATTESAALGSTTTTSTTEAAVETTTTTTILHPVCGESLTAKVFKLQITPTSPNATYSFYSEKGGTIYSSKSEGELPVGVTYEEKICIEGGKYEFSMSEGACAYGYLRGSQIFWSCVKGTSTITIDNEQE